MTLVAHGDTKRVSEEAVRSFPAPAFTKTWHPFAHSEVLDLLGEAVTSANLAVTNREYSANVKGTKMFGVWTLDKEQNGHAWSIGFRNSTDKSMAIGICAGTKVFICDNYAFSGEYVELRKHTAGLDHPELKEMTRNAVMKIYRKLDEFSRWHLALKSIPISNAQFKVLTYDAMRTGVFPPSQFKRFIEAFKVERTITEEAADLHTSTLYVFHGTVTRMMRSDNLFNIASRTGKLTDLLDKYLLFRR